MFVMIDWVKVFTVIGNTLLVSIPEETFLALFALVLLGQFDFLGSEDKEASRLQFFDIVKLAIPVLSVVLLSNILRYTGVDANLILLFSIITMFSTILIVYKLYWDWEEVLKAFLFTVAAFIVLITIEFSYVPILLYVTGKTVEELNSSVFLNFIWSLPERVLEIAIVGYLIIKKATFLKAKIIRLILSSKILIVTTFTTIAFNIFYFAVIGKLICFDKILEELGFFTQVGVICLVITFPALNIIVLLATIYYISNKDYKERFIIQQELLIWASDIKMFAKKGMNEKVLKLVDEMEVDINGLYKEIVYTKKD